MTAPVVCPRCQFAGPHVEYPSGKHLRCDCGNCGKYIKFLPQGKRDPEAWKWKPPTEKQLAVIERSEKWKWCEPRNRFEAWVVVGAILREAEEE